MQYVQKEREKEIKKEYLEGIKTKKVLEKKYAHMMPAMSSA